MTTRYTRRASEIFFREVSNFSTNPKQHQTLRQFGASTPNALLQEFQDALSKKMRGVQFYPKGRNESYVYYPHEKYARGKIWQYGSRASAHLGVYEDDARFAVESRTIMNQRYGTRHPEYHTQQSKHLDTAVRKAAAALTAWGMNELAAIHARDYESSRKDQINKVNHKAREAMSNLGVGSQATPAFVTLKNMLHQITDLDVKSKVEDVTRYLQEETELRSNGGSPMFVYVGQDHHGQRHFDTQRLKEIMYSAVATDEFPVRHYERSPQEGYNDLVGKINVLSMATKGEYITGVGMKADEDMFYVCQ